MAAVDVSPGVVVGYNCCVLPTHLIHQQKLMRICSNMVIKFTSQINTMLYIKGLLFGYRG